MENKYFKIESNYITQKNNRMEFRLIVESAIQTEMYKFHNIFSVCFEQRKNHNDIYRSNAQSNQSLNFADKCNIL